jgi:type III secretory pathway component EscR
MRILIPGFHDLRAQGAFEIGFLLFLLFLIIDLVVASVLTSMGMMILPPVVVSLPFKLIFFCSDRRLDAGRRLAHTKLRNIERPRRRTMLFRTISPVSHRRYS